MFAGHAVQVKLKRKQLEAPVDEYISIGHLVQVLMLIAPATVENVPARQLVHTLALLAPDTPEYLPIGHAAHVSVPLLFLY